MILQRLGDFQGAEDRRLRIIPEDERAAVTRRQTQQFAFGLGDKEKALAQAQQALKDYSSDAVSKPSAEITLAQVQGHFGDLDSAIAALPHLLEVPAGLNIATLKLDPLWDPLRKDPRFAKLIAEPQSKGSQK